MLAVDSEILISEVSNVGGPTPVGDDLGSPKLAVDPETLIPRVSQTRSRPPAADTWGLPNSQSTPKL